MKFAMNNFNMFFKGIYYCLIVYQVLCLFLTISQKTIQNCIIPICVLNKSERKFKGHNVCYLFNKEN